MQNNVHLPVPVIENSGTSALSHASQYYEARRWQECLEVLRPMLMNRATEEGKSKQAVPLLALRLAGASLFNLGQAAAAVKVFERVLAEAGQRQTAEDWLNLASALDEAKQWESAEMAYGEALQRKPNLMAARLQWCALMRARGRQLEARASLEKALADLPLDAPNQERAMLLHAQGVVEHELNGYQAARPFMERAISFAPGFAEARSHLAMAALAKGDNAEGWAANEWRWGQAQAGGFWRKFGEGPSLGPENIDNPGQGAPLWRGQALGEASILIWEEQGLGDTLQFFRYVALLRDREPLATLLFWCRSALHPVFADWARKHALQLLPADSMRPEQVVGHEWHVPLMSLPFCLKENAYPSAEGTVCAPEHTVAVWKERLARYQSSDGANRKIRKKVAAKGNLRQVGLVWSGSQVQIMASRRNLQLQAVLPLLNIPNIRWHSLQVGASAGDIALSDWQGHIVDWSHHLHDFGETAGLVRQLDLVITVDTSVAHLAASLGIPTWVLTRYDSCWRWLENRSDSPWYPSVRLFRQSEPLRWESTIDAIAINLGEVLGR